MGQTERERERGRQIKVKGDEPCPLVCRMEYPWLPSAGYQKIELPSVCLCSADTDRQTDRDTDRGTDRLTER